MDEKKRHLRKNLKTACVGGALVLYALLVHGGGTGEVFRVLPLLASIGIAAGFYGAVLIGNND